MKKLNFKSSIHQWKTHLNATIHWLWTPVQVYTCIQAVKVNKALTIKLFKNNLLINIFSSTSLIETLLQQLQNLCFNPLHNIFIHVLFQHKIRVGQLIQQAPPTRIATKLTYPPIASVSFVQASKHQPKLKKIYFKINILINVFSSTYFIATSSMSVQYKNISSN